MLLALAGVTGVGKSYYKDKKASSKRYKKAAISLLAVGALIKFISDIKE